MDQTNGEDGHGGRTDGQAGNGQSGAGGEGNTGETGGGRVDDTFNFDRIFSDLGPLPAATRTPIPGIEEHVRLALQEEQARLAKEKEETQKAIDQGKAIENQEETTVQGQRQTSHNDGSEDQAVRDEATRMMVVAISDKQAVFERARLARKRKRDAEKKAKKAKLIAEKKAAQMAEKEKTAKSLEEERIRAEEQRAEEERQRKEEEDRAEQERRRKEEEDMQNRPQLMGGPSRPTKLRFKQRCPAHLGPNKKYSTQQAGAANKQPPPWTRDSAPPPPQTKKKYRFKPGTVALREIRKYQKSTELIMAKAPFSRLVREILYEKSDTVSRIQGQAMLALQEAAESITTSLFVDNVSCMAHAKRVTIKASDMKLAIALRSDPSLRDYML